eukprot:3131216-Rhodomonas_salina.1
MQHCLHQSWNACLEAARAAQGVRLPYAQASRKTMLKGSLLEGRQTGWHGGGGVGVSCFWGRPET